MDYTELVYNLLLLLITTFVPILGAVTFSYLRRKGLVETIKAKEKLVEKGVAFAEQAYWDLEGPDKYNRAIDWIAGQFYAAGIKFDEKDVKGLIEAAVYKMQEAWYTMYDEDDFEEDYVKQLDN